MARDIKFRAWDDKDKTMLDWLTMRQSAFNRENFTLMYDALTNKHGWELMQFAGIKDRKGVEVYEGDIVK